MEGPREQAGFRGSRGKGPELAVAVTSRFWPASGHILAKGLLADPVIEGVTVHVVPLLLNMDTIFILPIFVPPVVWLIIIPKSGGERVPFY